MTESEIQRIVRAMYEERFVELCHLQREAPGDAEYHSAANLAFADYFERQAQHGGNLSFLPGESEALLTVDGMIGGSTTLRRSSSCGRIKATTRSASMISIDTFRRRASAPPITIATCFVWDCILRFGMHSPTRNFS